MHKLQENFNFWREHSKEVKREAERKLEFQNTDATKLEQKTKTKSRTGHSMHIPHTLLKDRLRRS